MDTTYSCIGKCSITIMSVVSKLICYFNINPIKSHKLFFIEIKKFVPILYGIAKDMRSQNTHKQTNKNKSL